MSNDISTRFQVWMVIGLLTTAFLLVDPGDWIKLDSQPVEYNLTLDSGDPDDEKLAELINALEELQQSGQQIAAQPVFLDSVTQWYHIIIKILTLALAGATLYYLYRYVQRTAEIAEASQKNVQITNEIADATREHNEIITHPCVTVALVPVEYRLEKLDHIWISVQNHTAIHAQMKILIEYEVKRVLEGITTKILTPILAGAYDGKNVWNIAAMDYFTGHTTLEELKDRELKPNEEAILNITVQVSPFDREDFRPNPPRQYRWKGTKKAGVWVPNPVPKS